MKRLVMLAACAAIPFLPAAAATVTHQAVAHIADGDCNALEQALNLGAQTTGGVETGPVADLIVLAKNGSYLNCFEDVSLNKAPNGSLTLTGAVTIDGSGATLALGFYPNIFGSLTDIYPTPANLSPGYIDTAGSPIIFRNINLVLNPGRQLIGGGLGIQPTPGLDWKNTGNLIIESSSITLGANCGQVGAYTFCRSEAIKNFGNLILRNVSVTNAPTTTTLPSHLYTFVDNLGNYDSLTKQFVLGSVSMEQATVTLADQTAFNYGFVTASNSILISASNPLCNITNLGSSLEPPISGGRATSVGGNIFSDDTCGFDTSSDRVVTDAGLGDFGNHGGVVGTLALNYGSPAIGAGLAANCSAADARGVARGTDHCDAGAYEFGGGNGKLDASGISGIYYDAAHDGNYVTVQSLDGGGALVIWNTFNEAGKPAWVYGVGTLSGNTIHVENVSQNLGGVLQPGGVVLGSNETAWGSFDFTATNCLSATLKYQSANPLFGSGTITLTRLAFVEGLDCSQ